MKRPQDLRKEPRQARSRFVVETILEAAARVFDELGYEATTTNRIAEVAGVSIGSLYQYFPSKDAVITALHERHAQQMVDLVSAVELAPKGSLRESTEAVIGACLALHRRQPRLQRLLHAELPTLEHRPESSAASRAIAASTQRLLAHHRDEVRRANLELATFVVLRIFEDLIHAAALDPPPGVDDAALERAIGDAVLGYLTLDPVIGGAHG